LDSALDALVMRTDNSSLANDVRKEMKQIGNKLLKTKDRWVSLRVSALVSFSPYIAL
jgi:hypothetical protein